MSSLPPTPLPFSGTHIMDTFFCLFCYLYVPFLNLAKANFGHFIRDRYSVMQSDGNSFFGNVVLDFFKRASWDKDNILDQICKKQKNLGFLF